MIGEFIFEGVVEGLWELRKRRRRRKAEKRHKEKYDLEDVDFSKWDDPQDGSDSLADGGIEGSDEEKG